MVIVTGSKYNFVENLNDLFGKTIAIPIDYTSYNYLLKKYPNIKLKTTKNIEDALMLVSRGEADAFVGHLATSSYYINHLDLSDLKIAGFSDFEFKHRYLISKEKPLLLSIINKAFNSITKKDEAKIQSNWFINKKQNSINYAILWKVIPIFLSIFIIGGYFYLKLKLASLKLKYKDNLLKETQKIAHIGIWEFNFIKSTRYWSDEVYKICGLDKKNYTPNFKNFLDYIDPQDKKRVQEEIENSIEEHREYYSQHKIIRPDGSFRFVDDRGKHEYDKDGKYIKTVGIVLDVTTQRELELELTSLNQTLDQRVKEEVKKNLLQRQTLFEQSRLAQMGEMISMIVHQWRQPLSAISAISSVLILKSKLKTLNDEYIKEKAEDIFTSTKHLSSTIDDFRNFFKKNKVREKVDYEELIKSVLSIVKITINRKKIKLFTEFTCDEKFDTYANELKQVILSIIKNSEDILVEKKIKNPYVKIKSYTNNGENILEISDNGGGISKDIIDKIFEPYFSTKTKADGTGLGLYMSKTIVEEHCGGKLEVENTKDGAIFKIIL